MTRRTTKIPLRNKKYYEKVRKRVRRKNKESERQKRMGRERTRKRKRERMRQRKIAKKNPGISVKCWRPLYLAPFSAHDVKFVG